MGIKYNRISYFILLQATDVLLYIISFNRATVLEVGVTKSVLLMS